VSSITPRTSAASRPIELARPEIDRTASRSVALSLWFSTGETAAGSLAL